MRFTIKSRKHGEQDFWANEKDHSTHARYASSYVYLEDRGSGCTGSQICDHGRFRGNTITCNGTPEGLAKVARRWWKARMRNI